MTHSRREARRNIRLPVQFKVEDGSSKVQRTSTRDISVIGVFVEQADVELGQTMRLEILIGEVSVEAVGEVVRREGGGLAVQFSWASENARELLAALVASAFEPHLITLD